VHPNFTNRLRAELRRLSCALAAERAQERPDARRIRDLKVRREWLTDALWAAELQQTCASGALPRPGANDDRELER
jgi:hypothetical protein